MAKRKVRGHTRDARDEVIVGAYWFSDNTMLHFFETYRLVPVDSGPKRRQVPDGRATQSAEAG